MQGLKKKKKIPVVEIDDMLREAAARGDVDFLRECVASNKPDEYYLTALPQLHRDDVCNGNIFHLAIGEQQEMFIRANVVDDHKLFGVEVIQQLLCQPRSESNKDNPPHVAAIKGNVEMVKMFVNAFNSSNNFLMLLHQLGYSLMKEKKSRATGLKN